MPRPRYNPSRSGATVDPISGIVLAGGMSRRLGYDKALITVPDGRTVIRTVVEKLAAVCDEVLVVADAAKRYRGLTLPARLVQDRISGQGPLGGIHGGLSAIENDYALVVACDMPFLNPGLLRYMVEFDRHYQALVPMQDGRWHSLHAIYSRECIPVIANLLAEGSREVSQLVAKVWLRPLRSEEWGRFDPEGLSFFNLNSLEDLRLASLLWHRLERADAASWADSEGMSNKK